MTEEIRLSVQSIHQSEPLTVIVFVFPFPKNVEPEAALNLQINVNRLLTSEEPQHSSITSTSLAIVPLNELLEVYGTNKGNQLGLSFNPAQVAVANSLPGVLVTGYGAYDYHHGNANGPARAAVPAAGLRPENVVAARAAAAAVDWARLQNNVNSQSQCRAALTLVPFPDLVGLLQMGEVVGAKLR